MRAVITRVKSASVSIAGSVVGEIGHGLLILLGVGPDDTPELCEKLADKALGLRIFCDEAGKMNRSLADIGGQVLVVSQFTLYADCRKGKRPSFTGAALPELASIWGQETLWLTDAENEVIYDGSGVPWIVRLTLQTADGTLTAELSPEHLPPACLAEPAEETCEVFGVPVAAAAGPSHAVVSFVRGEGADAVGMRITMEGELPPLQELAARLVTQSLEPGGVLQLHQLETADIPVWRSEQLDEEAAYADERFGCYLPTAVALPFDRAHRELGEGRDWLTASWSADVQNLTVTVSHPSEIPTLVHADETARYDLRLPEDGAAVDPDARNFPVFYREELTRDVLAARLWQGDFAGCSGASFGVLEPDGTLLEISVYAQDPLALLGFLLDG